METSDQPMTVTAVVAAMKAGTFNREEYLDVLFKRMDLFGEYNLFLSVLSREDLLDEDEAKPSTSGLLSNIPFAVQDNIDTVAFLTTGGTPAFKDWQCQKDAPVVAALLQANGELVGKTNMHELGFGITSNNAVSGPVRNPYDKRQIAGGSAGGSAAAVAIGAVPFALGADTGGSVRVPAALCGCVGFRPSLWRYSHEGVMRLSTTGDVIGINAMSVEDIVLIDSILKTTGACADEPPAPLVSSLKGIRIGVPRPHFYDNLDPEVAQVMEESLRLLREAGVELIECEVANVGTLNQATFFPIILYEACRELAAYVLQHSSPLSLMSVMEKMAGDSERAILSAQLNPATASSAAAYHDAVSVHRPALCRAYKETMATYNIEALVIPTTPLPARAIGQDETVILNSKRESTFLTYIRNTDPSSNAGLPCITLPGPALTIDTKLPVGVELVGKSGDDARLLSIAQAIQKVFPPLPRPVPWVPRM